MSVTSSVPAPVATVPLRPGDHAAVHELARMAFGERSAFDPDLPRPAPDRHRCVYDGDRLVANAVTVDFTQAFGGRFVACGGLSGVMIATDRRGRGLGRRVVHDSLVAMRERGQVVSALYPTTASLYRSLGYEVAGWWGETAVALTDLPGDDEGLDWEPCRVDDARVREVAHRRAALHDGWVGSPEYLWRRRAHRRGEGVDDDCFVGSRDGAPVAAVWLRYRDADDAVFALSAGLLTGIDHHALVAACALVAAHATTTRELVTTLPEHVLAGVCEHPQRLRRRDQWVWMLRLVDVDGALEARGWNPAVEASVVLGIDDDPVFPANVGRRRLVLEGGRARVIPTTDDADVSAGVGTWARWYAGGSVTAAARRGEVTVGDPTALALLEAAVATGTGPATLPDFF
ncbi:MAG: GNAT family N-acetyltransferase [Actinomyces sp.]|nr:MAG: GNAT family N-acetyltransferase [Actinomyces sp.]